MAEKKAALVAGGLAVLSKGAALAKAGVSSTTVRDRVLLREAAVNISSRAARLSAMGVASLLQLQEWDGAAGQPATVAVDGSVFELYPRFKERMEGGIAELLGVEAAKSVKLVLAKDGSGIGASIIAAVAE
jgi:hexokinase